METVVEGALDDVLRRTLYDAQSGVWSVVYKVPDQVTLDLLRKDVIRETPGAHIANYFDTDAAAEGLSKRMLTASSLMGPIATFVRRKTDIPMENRNYSVAYASKDLMDL